MIKRNIKNFIQFRDDQLFGLNLLKFVGMFCISLSHYGIIVGSKDRESMASSNFMIFMINSLYAVDIFFLVSGYILGMKIEQLSLQKGALLITDRLLHLYPLYWVALSIYMILPYLTNPGYQENCMENILFISTLTHNIFNKFGCFEWGWYIAVEIQSLVFLIFILSFVKKNYYQLIVLLLLIFSLIYSLWICFEQNYKISYFAMTDKTYYHNYYQKMQFKIPSYLIGFLFGQHKKLKNSKNIPLSLISLFMALIFWVHIWKYQNWYPDYVQNAYQTFSRPIFCIGIVGLSEMKRGKLLSYFCQIISKILFSIYLLHYFLFQIFIGNNVLDLGLVFNFFVYFLIILIVATIFHILIESTIAAYLNQIRKKLRGKI